MCLDKDVLIMIAQLVMAINARLEMEYLDIYNFHKLMDSCESIELTTPGNFRNRVQAARYYKLLPPCQVT